MIIKKGTVVLVLTDGKDPNSSHYLKAHSLVELIEDYDSEEFNLYASNRNVQMQAYGKDFINSDFRSQYPLKGYTQSLRVSEFAPAQGHNRHFFIKETNNSLLLPNV